MSSRDEKLESLTQRLKERLEGLRSTFAWASIGDFTRDVPMYEDRDEFTETYVGVQVMLEVIRGQLDEMHALNADLARKIEELEKEVARRKELEQHKDTFIAFLGHELRNPLTAILYAAQYLKASLSSKVDREDVEETSDMIQRQGEYMTRIIRDLLDVSRMLHGKLELQRSSVELGKVLGNAVQTIRPFADEKKQELSVHLPHQPVIVHADPVRIEQIASNLLSNAIRYTEENGRIELHLDVHEEKVLIRVSDNGIGIEPDALEKIFESFFQSDDLHTRREGLGMGLAIARGLARLHGGDVTAHSEGVNRGSEFIFTIPLSA